ncbi:MAG: hypothetical protein ACPGVO_07985, partial [Spirulinaceae cyanobacterium]
MSREFWQSHNFRLEPWGLEFDTPIQWGEDATAPSQVELELEQTDWVACDTKSEIAAPRSLYFIDGRRRLDARFLGRQPERNEPIYGAFATYAVGAAAIDRLDKTARYEQLSIERAIALTGAQAPPTAAIP